MKDDGLQKNTSRKRCPNIVNCVIEIPRGQIKNMSLMKKLQAFRLDRILKSAMRYPANYGFIPFTLGEDGDPLIC